LTNVGLYILQLIDPEVSKVTEANFGAFLKEKFKFLKLDGPDDPFESEDLIAPRIPGNAICQEVIKSEQEVSD
jgi:hypothetical protein